MSADERRNQLRFFADSSAAPELKAKASYVLARDLQLTGSPDDSKEAVDRFKQAAGLPALSSRCAWHTVECACTPAQEQLSRETLSSLCSAQEPKVAAEANYALGQSYMRTGEHTPAREAFTRVIEQAPDSEFALGSTYYLAELDLAEVAQAQKQ